MTDRITKASRTYWQRVAPAEQLRHQAAALGTIDVAGRISERAARPIRTPIDLQWGSGNTRYQRLARPGVATLIAARCDTAPSGGPCVVTLVWESEAVGVTWLGEVRIDSGRRFGAVSVAPEVAALPEGAWIRAQAPSPANGATGVDVSLTVEMG